MSARLAAGVLAAALVRTVAAAGGSGMVLAKGDATAGAILLVLAERGRATGLYERTLAPDDRYRWSASGPVAGADAAAIDDYVARRRRTDPDLWVIELDHADALALVRDMTG